MTTPEIQSPQPALQIGDTIVVNVKQPHPGTIRMTLATPESVAYANELIADPTSGWTIEPEAAIPAPEGAQALLVQALEDIIEPFAYIERNLPEGYRLDGQAALQQINSREFYTRIAKEALAAHRAALSTPQPLAVPSQSPAEGDERAAFEAEMRCEEEWGHKNLKRDKHGDYLNSWTGAMWAVWQARAAKASKVQPKGTCGYCYGTGKADDPDAGLIACPQGCTQAPAPAPDHVPAGKEVEDAVDAKLGIKLLPPIRVPAVTAALIEKFAALEGVIVQAIVRDALVERFSAQAPAVKAGDARDAARWRWLRDTLHSAVGGGVEVNDQKLVYEDAEPGEAVRVFWYPDTPVGFYETKADKLEDAIDAAMEKAKP